MASRVVVFPTSPPLKHCGRALLPFGAGAGSSRFPLAEFERPAYPMNTLVYTAQQRKMMLASQARLVAATEIQTIDELLEGGLSLGAITEIPNAPAELPSRSPLSLK